MKTFRQANNLLRVPLQFVACLPLLLVFKASFVFAEDNEILFGSVAMDIPAIMYKRLSPLTDYLSKELGQPVKLKLSSSMSGAISDSASNLVELSYLTPVAYIKAHERGDSKVIVKTVTEGKASFRLMIVVRQDSPIKSIKDLVGKRFAFGDERALLQRAAVVSSGVFLEDFSEYRFVGHYDNIARGVLTTDFDAGILKDTMAYKWQDKGLRIIYQTENLPPYNITVSSKVNQETLEKIRSAFLKLDKSNPEDLKIIKAIDKKYDGFVITSDREYDIVRELIKPFD